MDCERAQPDTQTMISIALAIWWQRSIMRGKPHKAHYDPLV